MGNPEGTNPSGGDIDRARLQERIAAIEARVWRRLLGKLGAIARGHYDLDDVMASARRRMDQAALLGRTLPCADEELYAYVLRVAERVVSDAVRRERRQRVLRAARATHLGGGGEQGLDSSALREHGLRADVQVMLERLDPPDRQVVELIARGLAPSQVAQATGVTITAHQSRWRRIVARIKPLIWLPGR